MKKTHMQQIDKLVSAVLHLNVNSTTSCTAYQPALPTEARSFKKANK